MAYTPILAEPKDLQVIPGNLAQVINGSEPYSRQTGAEISLARARCSANPGMAAMLANTTFYVANASLFMRQGRQLLAGITGREGFNVVLGQDTESATNGLKAGNFYRVPRDKADVILPSGDVIFVEFKALKLREHNAHYGYFLIRTAKFTKDITPARAPFVRAAYGEGVALGEVMGYLASDSIRKISETLVYLPNEDLVAEALRELKDGEMLARACGLISFDSDSYFLTGLRNVVIHCALRGVPFKPARRRAAKKD